MAIRFIIAFLFCGAIGNAQTITFRGCQALFENQDYTFNLDGSDATGRNVYTTTPVTGDQSCGGIGTCEFKIIWNNAMSRWEFIADSGSGGFAGTFMIYSNTSASLPNPPSLTLGNWIENIPTTESLCGGNLSAGNATMTGSVQNTLLKTPDFASEKLMIFPNPVAEVLTIRNNNSNGKIAIFNDLGQMVLSQLTNDRANDQNINVSGLKSGVYFVRLESNDKSFMNKFIKL